MPAEAVLSCESCTRRKIKCDKQLPSCSNCERFQIKCNPVSRQRLPRGRNGGRKKADDSELRARINRLESLVKSMEGHGLSSVERSVSPPAPTGNSLQSTFPDFSSPVSHSNLHPSPPASDPGVGSSNHRSLTKDKKPFWAIFESEVLGLRKILDEKDSDDEAFDDDHDYGPLDAESSPETSLKSNLFILHSGALVPDPAISQQPPPAMVHALCDVYLDRVDRIFKVLHAPSLRAHLQQGQPYLEMDNEDPSVRALRFCVFFAAVNSLNDSECMQMFFQDRTVLLHRLRTSAEVGLAQAEVITARNIETLQALAIYLAAVRLNDSRPTTWALIALALRLARGLGLHREATARKLSLFQKEMRRRTWWCLCLLDMLCAKERGSTPIYVSQEFDTESPLRINDTDLHGLHFDGPVEERENEFCDLTQLSLARETTSLALTLNSTWSEDDTWQKRRATVHEFREKMNQKYLRLCDPNIPDQAYTFWVADTVMAGIEIIALRPVQDLSREQRKGSPNLLETALICLEKATVDVPEQFAKWRWWAWIHWHAMAVALSELCTQRDGPLVERAWPVVDRAFRFYNNILADSRAVVIWRPLEKLYTRAQKRRQARLDDINRTMHQQQRYPHPHPQHQQQQQPQQPQQQQPNQGTPQTNGVENFQQQYITTPNQMNFPQNIQSIQPGHPIPNMGGHSPQPPIKMEQQWPAQAFMSQNHHDTPGHMSDTTGSPDDSWMQFVNEYMDANRDTLNMGAFDGGNGIVF